jgi:hypothetical protein
MSEPLWTPEKTRAAQTTLGAFSSWLSSRAGKSFASYDDLHRYSTAVPAASGRRCGISLAYWATRVIRPIWSTPAKCRGAIFPAGAPQFR